MSLIDGMVTVKISLSQPVFCFGFLPCFCGKRTCGIFTRSLWVPACFLVVALTHWLKQCMLREISKQTFKGSLLHFWLFGCLFNLVVKWSLFSFFLLAGLHLNSVTKTSLWHKHCKLGTALWMQISGPRFLFSCATGRTSNYSVSQQDRFLVGEGLVPVC